MLLLSSCQLKKDNEVDLALDYKFKKDTLLQFIQNKDTIKTVFEIELAETNYEKETGLMHRKQMNGNQGMLFMYENEVSRPNFYMKNTFIALDLIYINSSMEIVDFNLNTTPLSEDLISSKIPSAYVLEVKSGTVDELALKLGNRIYLK